MGAVKNHFHDEICAAADDARDQCEADEPEATTPAETGAVGMSPKGE